MNPSLNQGTKPNNPPSSRLFKVIDAYLIDTGVVLGSGQYGNVYKGYESRNVGRLYAIKETPISNANADILEKKKAAAIREINSLRSLDHPHIIKFITAKQTDKHLYLVMEYCEGGSLESYVEMNQPDEKECLYLFSQIICAFEYLIKQIKRRHGDIKPANILLHDGRLKLADFGFSKQFVEENDQCYSFTGSPLYTSPQILEGNAYTTKSEIWSLGITLYYMLCYDPDDRQKSFPWWGGTDVHLVKEIKKHPKVRFSQKNTEKLSEEVRVLLQRMLETDEETRIEWSELFACPLFEFDKESDQKLDEKNVSDEFISDNGFPTFRGELESSNQNHNQALAAEDAAKYRKILSISQNPYLLKSDNFKIPDEKGKRGFDNDDEDNNSECFSMPQTDGILSQGNISSIRQIQSTNTSQNYSTSKKDAMFPAFGGGDTSNNQKQQLIVSLDVTNVEARMTNEYLPKIIEEEESNRLLSEVQEFILQKRSLSYFVYRTAKAFKECFIRFNLLEQKNPSISYFETLVLMVLCKRSKVLSEEIVEDIFSQRSGEYLTAESKFLIKTSHLQNMQVINEINKSQSYQPKTILMPTHPLTIQPGDQVNNAQGSQAAMKQSAVDASKKRRLGGDAPSKKVVVKITKEHWVVLYKNQGIKSAFLDKLKKETAVYRNNYEDYKEQLCQLVKKEKTATDDDRQALEHSDSTINLLYESTVIEDVLRFFLPAFQDIIAKLESAEQSEVSEEDFRYLTLIDDMFMIHTFESTFKTRPLSKINDTLDIQQFYFMRNRTHPAFLMKRIAQAYKAIFIS